MQEVKVQNLVLNVLTQEQFEGAEKDASQLYLTPDTSIDSSEKGVANGVATLDANAKVPTGQIPTATTSTLGGVKPDGTTITVTEDGTISAVAGGSTGGTTNYNDLTNKPTIGGVSLEGDVSLTDLGINLDGYATKTEIPTKTSQLSNDSGFITRSAKASSTQYGTVKLEYNSSTKTLNIVV